jgi:hypothetical protein
VRDPLQHLADALAGRYEPLREIGHGGTSIVYLANDLRHERQVALKVLRPELALSLGAERFLSEIKIAAGLNHPHILPVHDSGDADGILFFVMPFVEGESLRERLARVGPLPVDQATRIAREVADALSFAHSHGVVHRDIKPANILLVGEHAVVADFGIATAIGRNDPMAFSELGLVVGTPAYMSPEQARGTATVDGRSDLYSLGCVLYEMLAGEPPFVRSSPQAVLASHWSDQPASLRSHRPSIPIELEQAVTHLLAKLPADRFSTASQFVAALPADSSETAITPRPLPALRRRVPWVATALAAAAAVAGIALAAWFVRTRPRPALDTSLYLVLPFRHRGQSAPALLDGDQCGSLLDESLRTWKGVAVVDPLWVSDARARSGEKPLTLDAAIDLARRRGAGAMISGEVWQFGDSVFVRGVLYDVVHRGQAVRQHTVTLAKDLRDARTRFSELASALLSGVASPPHGPIGTASLAAWRDYDAGRRALLAWDLGTARQQLGAAVGEDPQYARANLGLATVLSWAGSRENDWRAYATAAVRGQDQLDPGEKELARALLDLSERRYSEACDAFRSMVQRDSLDFGSWFGLGDCLSRDPLVVADAHSPSSYRFRTSFAEAAGAFRRALEAYPSVHQATDGFGLRRLSRVLFTEPSYYRVGYRLTPDTVWYGAFPSFDHDSVAFVPYPLADVLGAKGDANPATTGAAVAYARDVLGSVTTVWLRAFPNSADVLEVHAGVLESEGAVGDTANVEHSALGAVVRARPLVRDTVQALRLAVTETRLRLKLSQFAAAERLADSLLRAFPRPTPEQAENIAGLAALTGRPVLAADLLEATASRAPLDDAGEPARVAPPLAEAALRLRAYASVGAPIDSLRASIVRTSRLIESYAESSRVAELRELLLERSLALAFPVLGKSAIPTPPPQHYILRMEAALAKGDSAGYRKLLADTRAARQPFRPGDYSIEGTFAEATTQLMAGDTADAEHLLDLSLNALPTLGTGLITEVPQAASITRAMALRAELAAQRRDRPTAVRWAAGAAMLWASAEPALHSNLERMRRIMRGAE